VKARTLYLFISFLYALAGKKSMEYLSRATKDDQELQKFEVKLKEVYDYFEENKKLPFIAVNKKGEYVIM